MNNNNNIGIIIFVLILFFFVFGMLIFITVTNNVSINSVPYETLPSITKVRNFITSPINLIIILLVILIITTLVKYNKMVSLKLKATQSEKNIDVYLKQRFDLIPNIVSTVKAYANYEENVLTSIVKIREQYIKNNNKNLNEISNLNNQYTEAFARIENYPELKANEAFLDLQNKLSKIESQLQAARRIYNMDVTDYNIYINKFPTNIFSKIFSFYELTLFEIDSNEKESINV